VTTHEASDAKSARTFPCEEIITFYGYPPLTRTVKFEACNKHYIRPSDSKNLTVLSRQFRVCGIQQSEVSEPLRVKGIQLRDRLLCSEESESVK
jgi:hypothetical protein